MRFPVTNLNLILIRISRRIPIKLIHNKKRNQGMLNNIEISTRKSKIILFLLMLGKNSKDSTLMLRLSKEDSNLKNQKRRNFNLILSKIHLPLETSQVLKVNKNKKNKHNQFLKLKRKLKFLQNNKQSQKNSYQENNKSKKRSKSQKRH